jgi:hypothetical protein
MRRRDSVSRSKGTRIRDLHEAWMKDPVYRKEYEALEGEFATLKTLAKTGSAGRANTRGTATRASRRSPGP